MNCPICASRGTRPLGDKNAHRVARCSVCGHNFVSSAHSERALGELYDRYSYEVHNLQNVSPAVAARLTEIVTSFEEYRGNNRLLDIGFGAGALLRAAHNDDWEVYGIELSDLAVEQARRNGFVNAVKGDFLSASYPEGFFSVIVATELLEHLPKPPEFIRQAARLLSRNGLFYVTTPNATSISSRLLGLDWSVQAPPEHLHLFSPRSLRRALVSNGFEDVNISCEGVNPGEILHHFRSRLRGAPDAAFQFNRAASASSLNEKLIGSRSGSLLKCAANWFLRGTALGDSMKAFSVKR